MNNINTIAAACDVKNVAAATIYYKNEKILSVPIDIDTKLFERMKHTISEKIQCNPESLDVKYENVFCRYYVLHDYNQEVALVPVSLDVNKNVMLEYFIMLMKSPDFAQFNLLISLK